MKSANRFEFLHRVTYSDCTVGNHVYYSRYFEIVEAARGEFFRCRGFSLQDLQGRDLILPVIEAKALYHAPARYDDALVVYLSISELSLLRIHFLYEIALVSGLTIMKGETRHVCTSILERPKRMPKELNVALTPYVAGPSGR